jgi:hypothetical protein
MISGHCHRDMAPPHIVDGQDEPPDVEGTCKYIAQPTMGGPPAWRLGKVLIIPHCKNLMCYKTFHTALDLDQSFGMT